MSIPALLKTRIKHFAKIPVSVILFACYLLPLPATSQIPLQNLYSLDTIQEVRITFNDPDWHYIMDSLKQIGDGERLIGSCYLNGVKFDSIGVRYKGNSSYNNIADQNLRKLPFNIKLNEVKKDQTYQGYSTLKLSNGFRDPSFIREVVSYEVLRKYLPAPKANFIKVYVNGIYLGLYTNVESLNKTFLQKAFGTSDGNFFKCDPDFHAQDLPDCLPGDKASLQYLGNDSTCYASKYERKSEFPDDWEQLIRLCRRLNHQPEKLEEILNINEALWMLAFNNVFVNLDSYTGRLCHNYYLFRDSTGQFRPLIWDLNMSFGGFPFANKGKPLTADEMQTLNPLLHLNNKERPLISVLLNNPGYRKMYIDHVRVLKNDFEHYDKVVNRLSAIKAVISNEVLNDRNKFYSDQAFKQNIDVSAHAGKLKIIGIRELMHKRIDYLNQHPLLQYDPSDLLKSVSHEKDGQQLIINIKADPQVRVFVYYSSSKNKACEMAEAYDDGLSGDKKAGDGNFFIRLDLNPSNSHYYIYAENENTGTFLPERAPLEVFDLH